MRSRPRPIEELIRDPAFPYQVGRLSGAAELVAHWLMIHGDEEGKAMGEKLQEVVSFSTFRTRRSSGRRAPRRGSAAAARARHRRRRPTTRARRGLPRTPRRRGRGGRRARRSARARGLLGPAAVALEDRLVVGEPPAGRRPAGARVRSRRGRRQDRNPSALLSVVAFDRRGNVLAPLLAVDHGRERGGEMAALQRQRDARVQAGTRPGASSDLKTPVTIDSGSAVGATVSM